MTRNRRRRRLPHSSTSSSRSRQQSKAAFWRVRSLRASTSFACMRPINETSDFYLLGGTQRLYTANYKSATTSGCDEALIRSLFSPLLASSVLRSTASATTSIDDGGGGSGGGGGSEADGGTSVQTRRLQTHGSRIWRHLSGRPPQKFSRMPPSASSMRK